MKLSVFSFSHKQPSWVTDGIDAYAKRFPREFPIELIELKPENRQTSKTVDQLLQIEANRFTEQFRKKGNHIPLIVLDEKGKDWTTLTLSQWLQAQTLETPQLAFLIGSADGIDTDLKQSAQLSLRLSSLTLPHGLAKLLLIEQLYRAIALIQGHPYHREG